MMMKRLVLAMLAIGGLSCGVDSGAQSSPAPDDDTSEGARAAPEHTVAPEFAKCNVGAPGFPASICELPADCLASGGSVGLGCDVTSTKHCCNFPPD
jgi:hypothetical protein